MRHPSLLIVAFALSACQDKGGGDDSGAASELRTLETCETEIADDVPAFFADLFRCVSITRGDGATVIQSLGLPPHPTAYYGEGNVNYTEFDTQGGTHFQNPNTLSEQNLTVTILDDPTPKGDLTIDDQLVNREAGDSNDEYHAERSGGTTGVSLDGVAEFHGVAAPGDDIAEEAFTFDAYDGHPEMTGVYHYHGSSPGPLEVLALIGLVETPTLGSAEVELFAVMCDGTLVLGCTEMDGTTPDDSDFDAQNGHLGDVVAPDGTVYFSDRYHTHVCADVYPDAFSPEIQFYESCNGA